MEALIIFFIFGFGAWAFMSEKSDERKADEAAQRLIKQRAFTEGQKSASTDALKELQRVHAKEIQQREVDTTSYLKNLAEINDEQLAQIKSEVIRAKQSNADGISELKGYVKELEYLVAALEGEQGGHNQKQQIIEQASVSADLREPEPEPNNEIYDSYLKKIENKRQQKTKIQGLEEQRIEIQQYFRRNYNFSEQTSASRGASSIEHSAQSAQSAESNKAKNKALQLKLDELNKLNHGSLEDRFKFLFEKQCRKVAQDYPSRPYHKTCSSPYFFCGCPIPAAVERNYQRDIKSHQLSVKQLGEGRRLFNGLSLERKKQWFVSGLSATDLKQWLKPSAQKTRK